LPILLMIARWWFPRPDLAQMRRDGQKMAGK
jgi:hypothetical protein